MQQFSTIIELQQVIDELRLEGKKVGFVPTMGALHAGHLSLVEIAHQHAEVVVVSIFVNPTQFNDSGDFEKYPRNVENDLAKLRDVNTDIVFTPTNEEVYPEKDNRQFDFGPLANVMEGEFRPGHFNGVAQVVSRLFDIVKPDLAIFGEKDFQQLAVIRQMVRQYNYPVQIIGAPIMREPNGLAMSSRNERLSEVERDNAKLISKALHDSVAMQKSHTVAETIDWVVNEINMNQYFNVEYFQIVNSQTLASVGAWQENCDKIGCIAVFCGDVRLIDNVKYSL